MEVKENHNGFMRVAIINLTRGGMSGGYRKYLRNIIPRIASHHDVEAVLCATPVSIKIHNWFEPIPNVKFIKCKIYSLFGYSTDSELIRQIKIFSPDVIFLPTERYFRFEGVPIINMIQNMEPFIFGIDDNSFSTKLRNWIQRIDTKRAILNSDRIIAITEFVRDFLIEQWNISDEKIRLIYYGINLPEKLDVCRPVLIPDGWKSQFLFTAGSIRPARGLEDLLYALNYLSDKSLNIPNLLIAGETFKDLSKYRKKLETWIQKHNLSLKVYWTEKLTDKEMIWCYQNCLAFIMTSRVESFGMVAGEAMSHGCVCIAADNPCLPEIFGNAAIYYPPKNYKALAEAIQTILSWDNHQRKRGIKIAKKRAAQFSWDITAEKTVTEFKIAVENSRSSKSL